MNDLISRQAAIDVIKRHYRICDDLLEVIAYEDLLEVIAHEIEHLPSAQPKTQLSTEDATFDTTFDCISRQAAIDAIYETFCYAYCDNCEKEMNEDLCGDCHRKYQNWAASKNIISKTINSLPSAQPEIVRCKDCCHNQSCDIQYHAQAGDMFFCAGAERRTDE